MDLQFFVKLSQIPDLADQLEDPDFQTRLKTDPAGVFADYGITIPPHLIPAPEDMHLPSPDRIAAIKSILAGLSEGEDDEEMFWFPFILRPQIPWFPFPWFPWFRGGGERGDYDPPAA